MYSNDKRNAYMREWNKKNWRKKKETDRKYYKDNREKVLKIVHLYVKNNSEKIKKNKQKYYRNNREKILKAVSIHQKNNIEKVRAYKRKWARNNPEKLRIKARRSLLIPKNKLNKNIRTAIWFSLKGNKKNKHWEDLVGYSLEKLMGYLESLFTEGMNWSNQGSWHIDHRKPISSFNFKSYNDPEFKQCWALCNLQPLWALDNLRKSNKL